MASFEHVDSTRSQKPAESVFQINSVDQKQFLSARQSHLTSDSQADSLPPLSIEDASQNLLNQGTWSMFNKSGSGDSLSESGAVLKISHDPANEKIGVEEKNAKELGINHSFSLNEDNQPNGEAIHLRFFARSTANDANLDLGVINANAPYDQTLSEHVKLTNGWTEYDFDGVAPANGQPLDLQFKTNSSVEIANVSITPESLNQIGLDPKDLTPAGEQANINQFRKGQLNVEVLDKNGQPIPDAQVKIEQIHQDFLFGTEVQQLHPGENSAREQRYEEALKGAFNFATITPYWPQVEKTQGKEDYSTWDKQVDWLGKNGLEVKAHAAFWPWFQPGFVSNDPAEALGPLDRHTKSFMEHFAKDPAVRFYEDNEVSAAEVDPKVNGLQDWVKNVGAVAAYERETNIQKGVLATEPGDSTHSPMQLVYNDYQNNQHEMDFLDQLQKKGELPDAIGIQMHMTQGNWPLEKVEKILHDLSKYDRPIYITEISVLSGEHRLNNSESANKAWPSTPAGEQEQAKYVDELYRALYSNPHVKGITWWDLTDNQSWENAPRGLLEKDNTPKPAYDVLKNLTQNEWKTNELDVANVHGDVSTRVFAGDYNVSFTDAQGKVITKKVHVAEGGEQTVILQDD